MIIIHGYEAAGAWLLGHDMARLLTGDPKTKVSALLARESDPKGPMSLIGDMPADPDKAMAMLSALSSGFNAS